jgi:FtsP/CotA-like multicopper oxidase with cupredoxin domain
MLISRRKFLLTSVAAASAALAACAPSPISGLKSVTNGNNGNTPRRLVAETRSIEVNGRAATVFGLRQPNGTRGLFLDPSERFAVELENRLNEPTIVHWHGQEPPPDQDGVSQFGVPELQPGERRAYDFAARPGTYWMHSHHGFQEQQLLAAPLIVRTADDVRADIHEVTIFLEDFLFRDPAEVMSELRRGNANRMDAMAGSSRHENPPGMGDMPGMSRVAGSDMRDIPNPMPMKMDLNDVDFDAYLANDRTLEDPEIIRVERGARVRLRIINGASSTNFHVHLGRLQGTVAAVDGDATQPLSANRFNLAMAQRIDILLELPSEAGVWPVLAVREGDRQQTGIILATYGANVGKFASVAMEKSAALDFDQEVQLSAAKPLALRSADAHFMLMLTGSMYPYVWGFNDRGWDNRAIVKIRPGQRVTMTFHNVTMMSHPIHLHGHHFQVVALNGNAFSGALRDTVHVPPMAKVTVAFDADNSGRWLMHCHNLYHMLAGMITEVAYA